jgi:hypothetical protein
MACKKKRWHMLWKLSVSVIQTFGLSSSILRMILLRLSVFWRDYTTMQADQLAISTAVEDWKAAVEEECNIGFDLKGEIPYWKVGLLRCQDPSPHDVLLVKYHHSIGDGSSGYVLINDILRFHEEYLSLTAATTTKGADANAAQSLCSSLDRLPAADDLSFPAGRTDEQEVYVEAAVSKLQAKRHNWKPTLPFTTRQLTNDNSDAGPGRHSMLYADGTVENLERLLSKCREQKVTVGAILAAATYFTVAKQQHKPSDLADFCFNLDMDVNLRKRFPEPLGNDHVGAYIGMMAFASLKPTSETSFWEFVKEVHAVIKAGLEEEQHFHYLEVNRRLDQRAGAHQADGSSSSDAKNLDCYRHLNWKDLKDEQKRIAAETGYNETKWNQHGHAQDMNFSSFGRYFFEPTVGSTSLEKVYCVGGGWCPTFGAYVFLIPSVKYLNFSIVYESDSLNEQVAENFLESAADLTERAWKLPDTYTLAEFMESSTTRT